MGTSDSLANHVEMPTTSTAVEAPVSASINLDDFLSEDPAIFCAIMKTIQPADALAIVVSNITDSQLSGYKYCYENNIPLPDIMFSLWKRLTDLTTCDIQNTSTNLTQGEDLLLDHVLADVSISSGVGQLDDSMLLAVVDALHEESVNQNIARDETTSSNEARNDVALNCSIVEDQSASSELIMQDNGASLTVANNVAAQKQLNSLLITNEHRAQDNASEDHLAPLIAAKNLMLRANGTATSLQQPVQFTTLQQMMYYKLDLMNQQHL